MLTFINNFFHYIFIKNYLKARKREDPMTSLIRKMINFSRRIIYQTLKTFVQTPPYDNKTHKILIAHDDPIRYTMIALAINSIKQDNIKGSLAEVGVYKGQTSKIIHLLAPNKKLYLFDTFEGFPIKYLEKEDKRFRDNTIISLEKTIGNLENITIRKGVFPDTAKGLENEQFSFVMIDLDLYEPTLEALKFFYPRITSGGYIFIHDYNNPKESQSAVYKAVNKFIKDKAEKIIEIPDKWGTALFRKISKLSN